MLHFLTSRSGVHRGRCNLQATAPTLPDARRTPDGHVSGYSQLTLVTRIASKWSANSIPSPVGYPLAPYFVAACLPDIVAVSWRALIDYGRSFRSVVNPLTISIHGSRRARSEGVRDFHRPRMLGATGARGR